ncbi:UNVERIFIED_ORG: hypothetical protein LHJ69_12865 [Shinella sp. XGS7]|nr:hypothetical protein [Shinella sp. XGS7]
MALIFSLMAQAGQSAPTDAITGAVLTLTGGSVAIYDDPTYGKLWRLIAGYAENGALSGQGLYGDGAPKTLVYRFRVLGRQAAFTRWCLFGTDVSTGLLIGNAGSGGASASPIRAGAIAGGSMVSGLNHAARNYTEGEILTVVLRANFGTTDLLDVWYTNPSRVGTDPDVALSGAFTFGSGALDTLRLTAATGETVDTLDIHAFDSLLTNAQAVAAVNDIRGFLVTAGDTTPPVLTAPSGTATGANTATINATTNEAGGTLYCLVNTSATATEAAVLAGSSQAVAAAGVQTVNVAGLLPSTVYYPHLVHVDPAGNKSNVANGASFTTAAAPATALTLTGPTGGQVGTPSTPFTVGANGTVNGSHLVTPSDAGAGGIFAPASVTLTAAQPTATVTYTAASTGAKTISVADANGYAAAPSLTYTASTTAGTITSSELLRNVGKLVGKHASAPFEAMVYSLATGALVLKRTGLTSSAAGVVSFSDGALSAGASYRVVWRRTDTGAEGMETLTAA